MICRWKTAGFVGHLQMSLKACTLLLLPVMGLGASPGKLIFCGLPPQHTSCEKQCCVRLRITRQEADFHISLSKSHHLEDIYVLWSHSLRRASYLYDKHHSKRPNSMVISSLASIIVSACFA